MRSAGTALHRSPWRGVSLWPLSSFFYKLKSHESGLKNVAGKVEISHVFTTTTGKHYSGYGESVRGSVQAEIIYALRSGNRDKASCLLSGLTHGNNAKGAADFLYILDYCMRRPDPLFAMETWRDMEEKEIGMSGRCYFLVVRALSKGGYLQEAFNLMNLLREKRCVYPMLPLYNSILESCIKLRSLIHVNLCLDLMEQQSVGKDEVTYWELLKLAVWQQNISAVNEIWEEYLKYYCPSILSLQQFIWSLTKLGHLQAAYDALQHMVTLALNGSSFLIRSAEGNVSSSRLDIPIPTTGQTLKSFSFEEIGQPMLSVFDCRKTDYNSLFDNRSYIVLGLGGREAMGFETRQKSALLKRLLKWSFTFVIHASAHGQNCRLAEQLILQMQGLGLEPSSYTYDGLVRAIVSDRGFLDGLEVLKIMQEQNLKPHNSTLATLSIACSNDAQLDLAEALLWQISRAPQCHPFNVFLSACDALDQPERAVRILSKMKQLNLQPDIRTYELLFSLFGNVNAPYEDGNMLSQLDAAKRINAIELDMANHSVQHSHLSMKNMLKALGREGMVREMIHCFHMAESQLSFSDLCLVTDIYNAVLQSLVEAKDIHLALGLFKRMKLNMVCPDIVTYNTMIDCCHVIGSFRSACAIVSMMVRDGFYPQLVTYTILIKILLKQEDFHAAFHLLNQAFSVGIKPDVLIFNTILEEAFVKGRIDLAELIVEQMHRFKIKPDPSTCSYIFRAYLDAGFLNTAMEALQVLSIRMISEEENTPEEKRSEYEDFIFAEDPEAEFRIVRLFQDSQHGLASALLNLRWIAMLGFPISWLPDQSSWVARLRHGNRFHNLIKTISTTKVHS